MERTILFSTGLQGSEDDPDFLTEDFRTDDLFPTPEEMAAEVEGKGETYKVEETLRGKRSLRMLEMSLMP